MLAAMMAVRVRTLERRSEQQRRIDTATRSVLAGVESFRRDPDAIWPEDDEGPAVEVHAKAHLRLIETRSAPRPTLGRSKFRRYDRAARPLSRSRFYRR